MRANRATATLSQPTWRSLGSKDAIAVVCLVLFVGFAYGARLGQQPIVGEESRWATGAQEMLATGDWTVPRQQGQVFPERPPMTMWMMAAAGWLRGDVDPIAIRLPSVIAVVLTSLLVYAYARVLLSQFAALAAALVYATFGQVLQIGRLGESEALFALLVSASLLLWHLGYVRHWRPLFVWSVGFAFAALAALVKGPQAPVYFGAITFVYLLLQRDWRYAVSWQVVAGAALFAAIVATWQIPFYRAAGWDAVVATWAGLAGDRIYLSGVLSHLVTYPAETVVCLLPWSPMLIGLMRPGARKMLADKWPVVAFLLTAIAVAYPTVWLAAGARGRYFMPIYPLVAVLIGLLIERCSTAVQGTSQRYGWHQFIVCWALVIGGGAIFIGGIGLAPGDVHQRFYQPRWFCASFALIAGVSAYVLWANYRRPMRIAPAVVVLAIGSVAAMGVGGMVMNINIARWFDPTTVVAELKREVPSNVSLVSFSPIDHRFAYYYRTPVAELEWPRSVDELPPDVEYFCFMRQPGDTAESRFAGRGRTGYRTPGTLPFAWQEVASICVDRTIRRDTSRSIVLGRVVRPLRETVSDVTVPQQATAEQPVGMQRK